MHSKAKKAFDDLCSGDKCGNPTIYLRNNKMTKRGLMQNNKYSQHCAMWGVFKAARYRIIKKWFWRLERARKKNRTTEKWVSKLRQDLKKEKLRSRKLDYMSKIEGQQRQEISDLKSDLRNALEEKRLLEKGELDTIIPTSE